MPTLKPTPHPPKKKKPKMPKFPVRLHIKNTRQFDKLVSIMHEHIEKKREFTKKQIKQAKVSIDRSNQPRARAGKQVLNEKIVSQFFEKVLNVTAHGLEATRFLDQTQDAQRSEYDPKLVIQTLLHLVTFGNQAYTLLRGLSEDSQ